MIILKRSLLRMNTFMNSVLLTGLDNRDIWGVEF